MAVKSTVKAAPGTDTHDEAAVRSVVDGIRAAWADNDGDAFADAYTEDASLILSGDRYLSGREMIRKVVTQQFSTAHLGTTLLQDIVDLRFIGPGSAVAITEGGVLAPGEVQPAPARAIRATWVLSKQDGKWFIAAYQNTRNEDAQLPGA
jgi:uncharacterized protein (TIGR02246 family)